MERIEALQRSGKTITGVPSGFVDLGRADLGLPAVGAGHRRGPPLDGKDGAGPERRRPCGDRAPRSASRSSRWKCRRTLVQRLLSAEALVDSSRVRRSALRDADFTRLARAAGILQRCPDLDRRFPRHHPARDALQGAAAQGGARHRHGRGGLSPADAQPRVLREPGAGDLRCLALAQGARSRAPGSRDRPVAALARIRTAGRGAQAAASSPICATPGPSSRMRMSSSSSTGPSTTTKKTRASAAWRRSSWPSTGTAPPATSTSGSAASSRGSTTSPPAKSRPEHGAGTLGLSLRRVRARASEMGGAVRGMRRLEHGE